MIKGRLKKTQTAVNKTQHNKLETDHEQHEPQQKLGEISGASEGLSNPAPHVATIVLFMLVQTW